MMPKVLIAEDDLFMVDLIEETLIGSGYEVCGIARTVEEGIALIEHQKPDLAILDMRLANGGLGTDIAARLIGKKRPGILYATGNGAQIGLTRADGEACLSKPYRLEDLVSALQCVEQIMRTGKAAAPLPRGLCVLDPAPMGEAGSAHTNTQSLEIRRLRRQQAALAGFGSFALGERDLGKVLTEAARVCAEGLEVPFCKVCRYRSDENDLLVEAGVGWHQGVIGHVVSRADETSPQGRAFVTGEPVICSDLRADSSFVLPQFYAEHGIISTVDVIIQKEGQPYGVLEIDSPVQHDYDQHDIVFLTGFANVLAEAVNTSKRNVALQGAVNRMEEMVADRDHLLVGKNVLLAEKNRLLDDKSVLAQELQHRVRNNLQFVHGMLSKQLQSTAEPSGREGLGAIARRVMTLAQVYDHLLGIGLSRTIDFGAYLSSLCSTIESLQTERHADVALIHDFKSVTLDLDCATALGLVISELISNSYDHAFPDGKGVIRLSLSCPAPGGEGIIVLADDGVGFVDAPESKRHGLGLVRRLMQQVDGTATLRSSRGSEWTLRFPLPATSPAAGKLG